MSGSVWMGVSCRIFAIHSYRTRQHEGQYRDGCGIFWNLCTVGCSPASLALCDRGGTMKSEELFRSPLIRLPLGSVFVVIAAALRIWPLHSLESTLPWVTFYPAVIAAALLGGLWVGLIATGLTCATVLFLWPLFAADPFIRTNAQWI